MAVDVAFGLTQTAITGIEVDALVAPVANTIYDLIEFREELKLP